MTALTATVLGLVLGAAPPQGKEIQKLREAKVAAARRTYELLTKQMQVRVGKGADVESLCLWSRRWLEAEREAAADKTKVVSALEAHLARMRELEINLKNLIRAKLAAPGDAAPVEFYRLEAEIWLAQAKRK